MTKQKNAAGRAPSSDNNDLRTPRPRAISIKTPRMRAKLPERKKPYFFQLGPKTPWSIGYRKTPGARVWVLRYRHEGEYRTRRLASADDNAPANGVDVLDFDQALSVADAAYKSIVAGAPDGPTLTVRQAVREYLADREAEGKNLTAPISQFEAHILPKWGDFRVADLTAPQLKAWRDQLATSKPRVRVSKFADSPRLANVDLDDPEVKRRRRSTANRITTTFKAALNYAAKMHRAECPNRDAWRDGLAAFEDVEVPRDRWLTQDEVVRLLNACRPDFRRLVQAALYTGCRYGELCRAKVGHYNADIRALRIPTSKSGKWRDVILHDEAVAFFDEITRGRPADAWLLTRTNTSLVELRAALAALGEWSEESVKAAIAATAAKLETYAGTVARPLRACSQIPSSAVLEAALAKRRREDVVERIDHALTYAEPWKASHQIRLMGEVCKAARIHPPITFHGLRHTYASLAAQSGMALMALARNLGHVDTRMVEKHYGHLSDKYMREQVANFAPTFGIEHGDGRVSTLRPGRSGSKRARASTRPRSAARRKA